MASPRFVVRPKPVFRLLLAVVVMLVSFSMIGQVFRHFLGHRRLLGFVRAFHVDFGPRVPAVFSIFMLMANALVLWIIATAQCRRGPPSGGLARPCRGVRLLFVE